MGPNAQKASPHLFEVVRKVVAPHRRDPAIIKRFCAEKMPYGHLSGMSALLLIY